MAEEHVGEVSIAEEVVRTIAAIAASEIEGLSTLPGSVAEVVRVFGGRGKGVETEVSDGRVKINLRVAVRYGPPLHELARRIQEKVKEDVEKMTGLQVDEVNVYIQKLALPREELEAEMGTEAEAEAQAGKGEEG